MPPARPAAAPPLAGEKPEFPRPGPGAAGRRCTRAQKPNLPDNCDGNGKSARPAGLAGYPNARKSRLPPFCHPALAGANKPCAPKPRSKPTVANQPANAPALFESAAARAPPVFPKPAAVGSTSGPGPPAAQASADNQTAAPQRTEKPTPAALSQRLENRQSPAGAIPWPQPGHPAAAF